MSDNLPFDEGFLVFEKFHLVEKIGCGAFGNIYAAVDPTTGQEVAIKLGIEKTEKKTQLLNEACCYRDVEHSSFVPSFYGFGRAGNFNSLVIDREGPSLEDAFKKCRRKLGIKTVLQLAEQMLVRVEYLHIKGYVHRDIKPDNMLLDKQYQQKLLFIDFGLAKKYRDQETRTHMPLMNGRGLMGTGRYVSLNVHMGVEASRRDDLETIGYVLLYLAHGRLPWMGLRADDAHQKYDKMAALKRTIPLSELCEGLPTAFQDHIQYCRQLKYAETPDYRYLRSLFHKSMEEHGFQYDFDFEWNRDDLDGTRQIGGCLRGGKGVW